MICAYDFTRCWEKLDPVAKAVISRADAGVETKICALAEYCGVAVKVTAAATPTPKRRLRAMTGRFRVIKRQ